MRRAAARGAFANVQLSIYDATTYAGIDRATPAANVNSIAFAPNGGAIVASLEECGSVIVCN